MKEGKHDSHLAVLIDGDNVSPKFVAGLMAEIANYGNPSVKRIYGDWSSPTMKSWSECLPEHAIQPMQQFAYRAGKNATDIAMIIDAMDLLYTGRFSSFCLVSSDSDFTRLAARIREQGISVYGFGNRKTTNRALVNACNEFIYFDALPVRVEESDEATDVSSQLNARLAAYISPKPSTSSDHQAYMPTGETLINSPNATNRDAAPVAASRFSTIPVRKPLDRHAIEGLREAVNRSRYCEEDFVDLAHVGHVLRQISPDLNAKNYGYARLSDFAVASGIAELRTRSSAKALRSRW